MHQAGHKRWHPEKKRPSKRRKHLENARQIKRQKTDQPNPTSELTELPVDSNDTGQFLLVHSSVWRNLLKNIKCSECGELELDVTMSCALGFASKIKIQCTNCEWIAGQLYSSPRANTKAHAPYLVNKRMVGSINSIGLGFSAMQGVSAEMTMECLSKTAYQKKLASLHTETSQLKEIVLALAQEDVRESYMSLDSNISSEDIIDTSNSYDGTWQRRGHKSLYGIGLCIDILTGLVVDFEVLSKFCYSCTLALNKYESDSEEYEDWKKTHQESGECDINFSGSSGAMEAKAAEVIWKRSVSLHKLRYTTILSDGDAKTWMHLQEIAPYGENISINKEECVNHVSKRLGKALREVAKKEKLGGRKEGSLTEKKIVSLNGYYRKAIASNINDIDAMKKEILAALDHCSSTNSNPKHHKCPVGRNSWCFYNRAQAEGHVPHDHSSMSIRLSDSVVEKIRPVYERLSEDELLLRCIRGKTQNANECLHSLIWRKCQKEIFVSKKRIEIAVTNAVSEFNNGIVKTMQMKAALRIGEELHDTTVAYAEERDKRRESMRSQEETVKQKQRRNQKKHGTNRSSKKSDEQWYGAGCF